MEFSGKIVNSLQLGNYVVASRKITEGEIILREYPIFIGPYNPKNYIRICLACHKEISISSKCSKCKWPICGQACEKSIAHSQECEIFSRRKVFHEGVVNEYYSIETLRCLLKREELDRLLKFESHSEQRKQDQINVERLKFIINFIKELCGLGEFQEDILRHVVGVLAINTFWTFSSVGRYSSLLFDKATLFAHDCNPNTDRKILELEDGSGLEIEIRAHREIEKGENISINYVAINCKVEERRDRLWKLFYFHCNCFRCLDELSELKN